VARLLLDKLARAAENFMNSLLIVGILIISTAPPFAQAQQPNAAKLKSDAQKVVSIISGDKAKAQAYCQINDLGGQIGEANEEQDNKKAEALSRKVSELEKKLGPEYVALVNGLKDVDPNSPEGAEISSILAPLDDSCPDE
jgi:hypothetical protein